MNKCLLGTISITMLEANFASKAIYIASSWGLNAYRCSFITKNIQMISFQARKKNSTIIRYFRLVGKNTPFREHNIISFYSKYVSAHC